VAVILRIQGHVGDGGKLGFQRGFGGDALRRIGEQLGVGWGARNRKTLHEAARSIAAVTVVQAHGVARESKLRCAYGLFDAVPQEGLPENLRAVRSHLSPAAGRPHAARRALHGDVVGVQALQFGVEVRGKDAFLRGQLQRVGQRIVPLAQHFLPVGAAAVRAVGRHRLKAVFQVISQRAQQGFVGLGMQAPDAVEFLLFFDQAQPAFAGAGIKEQDPDVHPLVADEIRRVSQDAVGAGFFPRQFARAPGFDGAFIHDSHPAVSSFMIHVQFGNGWRLDLLACRIKSGTRWRRRCSCSSSRSTAS
jgi:hypothetical protein